MQTPVAPAPPVTAPTAEINNTTLAPASAADGGAAAGHGREASGRSVLSNISSRLAAIRERERSDDYVLALNRLQLARQIQDIEAAVNAEAAAAAAGGTTSSGKKENLKARRERDEASALVGPSLAHYFGSGSSSSGAVTGSTAATTTAAPTNNTTATTQGDASATAADTNQPSSSSNAIAANAPTTPGALPETPGGFGSFARRARLGSRGRARGASLSGLSTSIGTTDAPNESPTAFNQALPGSPTTGGDQLNLEALTEAVAMAEGIDIDVLKQWIDRSLDDAGAVEIDGVAEEAAEKAMQAQSYCTTLQSLVNLKRNTIHLMAASTDLGVRATSAALPPVGENPAAEEGQDDHPLSGGGGEQKQLASESANSPPATTSTAVVQESALRPARSLSNMPVFGQSVGLQTATHGKSTHQLHFEYDCSSPYASVQVFLRASRKHGSWQSWMQRREEQRKPANADGAEDSLWFTRGPPPHVLGWPVHSSQVRKGFAQPVKASLTLQLELYAPPSTNHQGKGNAKGGEPETAPSATANAAEVSGLSAPAPSAPEPLTSADVRGIDEEELTPSRPTALAPIPADETKEQRIAREKLERETLKLAVVVEALDANGQPYPEPNLQTTYLRLTSLPIRSTTPALADQTAADGATSVNRLWTVHVEGQEAEIGSHRFQLQELYGLSSRPPPIKVEPSADGTTGGAAGGLGESTDDAGVVIDMDQMGNVGSECLICLSSPTNTLLLPCTHGLCLDCSIQLKESVKAQRDAERRRGKLPKKKYNCPMCRRGFTSMLHLKAVDPPAETTTTMGAQHDGSSTSAQHTRSSSLAKERLDGSEEATQFVIGGDEETAAAPRQHPL